MITAARRTVCIMLRLPPGCGDHKVTAETFGSHLQNAAKNAAEMQLVLKKTA